jgi:hypothetical protein
MSRAVVGAIWKFDLDWTGGWLDMAAGSIESKEVMGCTSVGDSSSRM